jgi:hypothetical protein
VSDQVSHPLNTTGQLCVFVCVYIYIYI